MTTSVRAAGLCPRPACNPWQHTRYAGSAQVCHARYTSLLAGKTAKRESQVCGAKGFGKPAPQRSKKEEMKGSPLADRLEGTSIALVGDSSELNIMLAQSVGKQLGYIPLHSSEIVQLSTGSAVQEIIEKEGLDALALSEVAVLSQLSNQLRTCISTCGYGGGAAARDACWRYLYGHVTVWIDSNPNASEASEPQRGAYANADVHIKLDRDVAALPEKTAAAALALKVMGSVEALLDRSFKIAGDKGLPFKKRLYVKLGCRGDWPEIQPPEWRPEQDGQAPSGAENA